ISLQDVIIDDVNVNTAVGQNALSANTVGTGNTAVGVSALQNNTMGGSNSAYGVDALQSNTTGFSNTAIGIQALMSNNDGFANTAVGFEALFANTSGFSNTAVGDGALTGNQSGDHNTAIGTGANVSSDALTNATAIGAGAVADASNLVVLGNTSVVLVKTSGDLRVKSCVTSGNGSTTIAGSCASDARLKKDIRPFDTVLEKLARLQPVHFRWRTEEYPELQLGSGESSGLIAQEVEKLLPELVTEDSKGFKAIHYSMLPLMLLQALKEQEAIIEREQKEIDELRAALKARVNLKTAKLPKAH
ncbi:MAG TPA: tail fiber domain-containing protein, partial [Candidatus Binatia bacterium]